jgi:hypothetical protein
VPGFVDEPQGLMPVAAGQRRISEYKPGGAAASAESAVDLDDASPAAMTVGEAASAAAAASKRPKRAASPKARDESPPPKPSPKRRGGGGMSRLARDLAKRTSVDR